MSLSRFVLAAFVILLIAIAPARADDCEDLHTAAFAGDLLEIEGLMWSGVDVDCRDETGATPLMAAALGLQPEAVSRLLDFGAWVNARDDESGTALSYADEAPFYWWLMGDESDEVEWLAEEVVDILLQAGGEW